MNTTAFETKYIAKTNRGPLRILHAAVAALRVPRQCFDHCLVGLCHLNHLACCSSCCCSCLITEGPLENNLTTVAKTDAAAEQARPLELDAAEQAKGRNCTPRQSLASFSFSVSTQDDAERIAPRCAVFDGFAGRNRITSHGASKQGATR